MNEEKRRFEESCRQETYTYPPCTAPKCSGTIQTLLQLASRKCSQHMNPNPK